MRDIVTLSPPTTIVQADCLGCDFAEETTEVIRKGFLGIGRKEETHWRCKALNKPIPNELTVFMREMKQEECPCKFTKWQQTNSEIGDFVEIPVYIFTIKEGRIEAKKADD